MKKTATANAVTQAITPTNQNGAVGIPLGKLSAVDRHRKRKAWFLSEASRQAANRTMMAKCEAMYDGEQYDQDTAEKLKARGQNPVVYNQVKPTIDWLIGTERKSRVDFVVIAEEQGEEASNDAMLKTKLLKYLDITNRSGFERSYASNDTFKAGLGWLEVGARLDRSGPPVYIGHESWRNMLWDSHAQKRDLSDARYVFRIKVVDLDVAIALFPEKEQQLRESAQTGDDIDIFREWMGGSGLIAGLDTFTGLSGDSEFDGIVSKPVDLFNARERVLLLECWSREPYRNPEPTEPGKMADPMSWRIMCSIMTEKDTLLEAWSPYKHGRFPFIPIWAYRNSRTGLPYGPVKTLIGPQESLNHRMSRSLYEASANQVWIEKSAIDDETMDLEEVRDELNDPNGVAVFENGAVSGNKVKNRESKDGAQFQMKLAASDIQMIRETGGVNGDNQGLNTNVTSGKAVLAKQEQGSLLTLELFDNLLLARQLEGELTLSVAEQFMTQPSTIRLPGDTGSRWEYTGINQPRADGGYDNDITARTATFVIGEQQWKMNYAEAAFDSLMQVMTQLASAAPNVVIAMLDIVFDIHPNLPKKAQILKRIREVNGQPDPDGKMTPEQANAAKQKALLAQAEFQAQLGQLQAAVKKAEAEGAKLDAQAMSERLQSLYLSAQAAQVLAMAPGITPIADELLRSVGFKDLAGDAEVIDAVAQPVAPAPTVPDPLQTDGAMAGSETLRPDGVM